MTQFSDKNTRNFLAGIFFVAPLMFCGNLLAISQLFKINHNNTNCRWWNPGNA